MPRNVAPAANVMRTRKPTFVSLFSGCGGFDLGFSQAGFRGIGAYDIDPKTLNVLSANLHSPTEVCDLALDSATPEFAKNPDVVIAGPPCQGFSTIGSRRLNDPRNGLVLRAAELAIQMNPRVFVLENVPGITAGQHGRYLRKAIKLLKAAGFTTVLNRVDVRSVGLAQIRKRVLLVAWRGGGHFEFTFPVSSVRVLRDVILPVSRDVFHRPRYLPPESVGHKIAEHIKPGQKLSNVRNGASAVHTWEIPAVFGRTNRSERRILEAIMSLRRKQRRRTFGDADPVSVKSLSALFKSPVFDKLQSLEKKGYVRKVGRFYDVARTFNGKYRRLSWDRPSFTVDTRFGDPRYFLHPSENRGFTVREAARIQGFPDSFSFTGESKADFKMIGNAVPPPLAKLIATAVLKLLGHSGHMDQAA